MTSPRRTTRRVITLLALLSLLSTAAVVDVTTAQPAKAADFPANPIEKPGWVLERNDEFNGTALDTSLWIPKYLESRTTEERSRARYGFRNGAIVLRIDNDQPTYYTDNPMKVSSIQTGQMVGLHKTSPFHHSIPTVWNYTAKYGYFEIRAKSSARSGIHTAFWTVGKQDTATQNAEIDVMEHPGQMGNSFLYNLHKWSDPNVIESSQTIAAGFDMTTEMHIYALEWTPTQIKLYVDNVLRRTINSSPAYPAAFLLGIYQDAGWTGSVDPADPRPKEFVIDYFRAYRKAEGGIVSGATYKLRNVTTGKYLDSDQNGTVIAANASSYDDQDWVVTQQPSGAWTIKNVRTGRNYLHTQTANNAVIWNSGEVVSNSLWTLESTAGGYRVNNNYPDRQYMHAASDGAVRWNTGSTDGSTVWAFERK